MATTTQREVLRRQQGIAAAEIRASGSGRTISWYASVFDVEYPIGKNFERVARTAFNKTVKESDVRALLNHDPNYVLGRTSNGTLSLEIDRIGLRASVEAPMTTWADDLLVSIRRGDVSAGSFAFSVIRDRWESRKDGAVRELQEVRLFDVSVVTYPASDATSGSVQLRSAAGPKQEEPPKRKIFGVEIGGWRW